MHSFYRCEVKVCLSSWSIRILWKESSHETLKSEVDIAWKELQGYDPVRFPSSLVWALNLLGTFQEITYLQIIVLKLEWKQAFFFFFFTYVWNLSRLSKASQCDRDWSGQRKHYSRLPVRCVVEQRGCRLVLQDRGRFSPSQSNTTQAIKIYAKDYV